MLISISANDNLIVQNKDDKRFLNIVGLIKNGENVKLYTDGNGSVALVENDHTLCFVTENLSFVDEVVASVGSEITFCGVSNQINRSIDGCLWNFLNYNLQCSSSNIRYVARSNGY